MKKSKPTTTGEKNWIWLPHAQHFIGAYSCQFRLGTYVGKYIVSTVGEYRGMEDIGCDRKYETYVFKAKRMPKGKDVCEACPFTVSDFLEIDSLGANTAKEAFKNHYKLCSKWSKSL
jgi:hypothetical protein